MKEAPRLHVHSSEQVLLQSNDATIGISLFQSVLAKCA